MPTNTHPERSPSRTRNLFKHSTVLRDVQHRRSIRSEGVVSELTSVLTVKDSERSLGRRRSLRPPERSNSPACLSAQSHDSATGPFSLVTPIRMSLAICE